MSNVGGHVHILSGKTKLTMPIGERWERRINTNYASRRHRGRDERLAQAA